VSGDEKSTQLPRRTFHSWQFYLDEFALREQPETSVARAALARPLAYRPYCGRGGRAFALATWLPQEMRTIEVIPLEPRLPDTPIAASSTAKVR
jgi:hypothetical protein